MGDQFRREATRVDVPRTELDATDSLSERRSYTPPPAVNEDDRAEGPSLGRWWEPRLWI